MSEFMIETERYVDASPDEAWAVIADAGGYHRVVDTLDSSDITSGSGEGMARHCVDTKGREWDETCTYWADGQAFTMEVDVDTYPAAFRAVFRKVVGTWSVTPTENGTTIGVRFDGVTRLGPLGKAAVAAMGRDSVLSKIMDGYERQLAGARTAVGS